MGHFSAHLTSSHDPEFVISWCILVVSYFWKFSVAGDVRFLEIVCCWGCKMFVASCFWVVAVVYFIKKILTWEWKIQFCGFWFCGAFHYNYTSKEAFGFDFGLVLSMSAKKRKFLSILALPHPILKNKRNPPTPPPQITSGAATPVTLQMWGFLLIKEKKEKYHCSTWA